jgi:hypothetical protein
VIDSAWRGTTSLEVAMLLRRRGCLVGLVLVALVGACARPPRPQAFTRYVPDFVGELPTSHAAVHASSARNSRVGVPSATYAAIDLVVALEHEATGPEHVLVAPDGRHVVLVWPHGSELRGPTAAIRAPALRAFEATADGAHLVGGGSHPSTRFVAWDGRVDVQRALRFDVMEPLVHRSSARREAFVAIDFMEGHPHGGPSRRRLQVKGVRPEWSEWSDGHGDAAIAADGHIVVALERRRLWVMAPEATRELWGVWVADVPLGFDPWLVSVVPPLVVVLERGGRRVHGFTARGKPAFRIEVPFAVSQPAIDAGDGHLALAGQGLAMLRDGRLLWSAPEDRPVRAGAFADGMMAVTVGSELRIVARDGSVRQRLVAAGGGAFSAPPAIAPDGAIWLASASALYRARPVAEP